MYKKTLFFMLFVTFQQDTLAVLDSLPERLQVCSDIAQGNAQAHSLDQINACASYAASGELFTELDCPELKCHIDECIFGFAKDEEGCHICKCVEKGKEELFEEDIFLTDEMKEFLSENIDREQSSRTKRDLDKTVDLWKNFRSGSTYQVHYVISSKFAAGAKRLIQKAIGDIAKSSCIRFVPRTNQKEYINFSVGTGCNSPVGRGRKQPQTISLGTGCVHRGTIIHEILHSLGFWHEQSRPDRDEHIKIHWKNIAKKDAYNFDRKSAKHIDSLGSPYDIGSIMHYSAEAFSINGRATITDLKGNAIKTQKEKLSQFDIDQLNVFYGCHAISENCEDKSEHCALWASGGECTKKPLWMKPNCCKSCSGGGKVNCEDKHKHCAYWARVGECAKRPEYMKADCCKSCA